MGCAYGGGSIFPMTVDQMMGGTDMMNERTDTEQRLVPRLTGGSAQVVAGMMYRVNVDMLKSECPNTAEHMGKLMQECPPLSQEPVVIKCTATIWSRPWLQDPNEALKITSHSCQ